MRFLRHTIALSVFVFPLLAQFNSSVEGVVTDRSGAVVPAASVTVANVETGVIRKALTSAEGFYRVVDLGRGRYNVTVEREGFRTSEQHDVVLEGSQTVRVNALLDVGAIGEKVTVAAEVPQVETEQGRISGNITTQDLQQLPLNGRNLYNVLALAPGVAGRGLAATFGASGGGSNNDSFAAENQPEMYANGQRVESNSYMLDDMSVNSLARGGVTNLTPNPDSIAEVRVVSNNFSAVNGRSSGGQVEVISKAGTNQFHGGASEYFQNNTLADRNVFTAGRVPVFRRNEFDVYAGGPIVRNRTFFFGSFEGLRQSGARDAIYTAETQQFATWVEQNYPNSIAAKLFGSFGPAVYPNTNLKTLTANPGPGVVVPPAGMPVLGSVDFAPAAYRNGQQVTGRIDHQLRPGKDTLYGNVYRTWADTLNGGFRPAFNRPGHEITTFVGLNEIHIFSPNKINELRAAMMRTVGTNDIPPNIQVPSISVPSITGFSTNGYPSGYFQSSFNYKDVFSWIHRSHTIKLGGELRRMRGNSINTSNYIPTYTFASILTFAADTAVSETRLVDPRTGIPAVNEVGLRDWEWALFVNDDWKVTPNLTLNVGLRYENYESPTEVNGLLRNLTFGSGPTLDQSLAGATAQTVQNFFPRGKGNLAPRFGFSWDPTGSGKTAIRGGFGIAYDRLFMTPLLNFRGNPPLRATATLGPIFGTAFTYSLGDPNKQYLGFPVDPALQLGLNAANGIQGARVAINAVDPTIKQAYTENFFFGIQRETWKGVVIEANYTGTAGHRLYNDYDINRYARDLLANGTFHGFNPYFSNVFMIGSGSNSIYQGGSLLVKRRFRNGFTLHGSYTYSKAIDDTDTLTNIAVYEDSRNRRLDRALAGFDVRNRLSLNGVWELPFLRTRKGVAAQVVGGWQLSGLAIFQSGSPLSVINSAYPAGDYNADGTASDRPNTPGANVARGGFSKSQFLTGIFPAAAFPIPTAGTDGNLGRNVFSGPSYEEIDATLAKQFSLTERVKLQVRIEAFNVLNRVNLNPPSGDLSSANFGKATSTLIPRQFQGGLRLSF